MGVSSIESVKRILITGTRHLGKAGLISEFSGLLQLAVRQSGSQAGRQAGRQSCQGSPESSINCGKILEKHNLLGTEVRMSGFNNKYGTFF